MINYAGELSFLFILILSDQINLKYKLGKMSTTKPRLSYFNVHYLNYHIKQTWESSDNANLSWTKIELIVTMQANTNILFNLFNYVCQQRITKFSFKIHKICIIISVQSYPMNCAELKASAGTTGKYTVVQQVQHSCVIPWIIPRQWTGTNWNIMVSGVLSNPPQHFCLICLHDLGSKCTERTYWWLVESHLRFAFPFLGRWWGPTTDILSVCEGS